MSKIRLCIAKVLMVTMISVFCININLVFAQLGDVASLNVEQSSTVEPSQDVQDDNTVRIIMTAVVIIFFSLTFGFSLYKVLSFRKIADEATKKLKEDEERDC